MEITEAIKILTEYNKWRRGDDMNHPNPTELGMAIDFIIKHVKNEKKHNRNSKNGQKK